VGVNITIWALGTLAVSILGFANALYFVLVAYRVMRPDARWLPRVCRMDDRTCASILETRYARVLGLPNALYGVLWYVAAGTAALVALATGRLPAPAALLGGSALAAAVSVYLAWALLYRLRVVCPLCFFGHGVNAALLALFALRCSAG
jgi:uncharacterized membrane protein